MRRERDVNEVTCWCLLFAVIIIVFVCLPAAPARTHGTYQQQQWVHVT